MRESHTNHWIPGVGFNVAIAAQCEPHFPPVELLVLLIPVTYSQYRVGSKTALA